MKNKIIIVDNDHKSANSIKIYLEQDGYEGILTANIKEAIEITNAINPVLVVIDLDFEKYQDRIELGNYLMENGGIPHIYTASFSDISIIEKARKTLPQGYIIKPFKAINVKMAVEIALNNQWYSEKNLNII